MRLRYTRTRFSIPESNYCNDDLTLPINSVSLLFESLNDSVVESSIAVLFHLGTADAFCNSIVKPLMCLVFTPDDGGQAVALHIAVAVAGRYEHVLVSYVSKFDVSAAHSAPFRTLRMKVLMTVCASAV